MVFQVEQPVRKYDSNLPLWANVYVVVHFLLVISTSNMVAPYKRVGEFIEYFGNS